MKKIKEILTNKNNYKYILSFVLVIVLLVMVGGISYAMFDYSRTGTKENVITTGEIRVAFAEQNNIKLQNRYAETDTQGLANTDPNSRMTFTVSSDIVGNATVNYAIGLTDIVEGATLKQDHIKIYLTKNGSVANNFTENTGKTIKSFEGYSVTNYLDSHAIVQGSVTGTQTDTYELKAWIDENYNLPTTDISSENTHSNQTTSETFSFKIKVVGTDSAIVLKKLVCDEIPEEEASANVPSLAKNMIPVCYNSTKNVWLKADSTNTDSDYRWYSYSGKTWANAVTVTESDGSRDDLVDAEVGTEIPMDRINTMLVWIPRFSATMTEGQAGEYTDTAYCSDETYTSKTNCQNAGETWYPVGYNNPGAFNITFVNKNTAAHDAFTFGDSVSGFWVGKFENSSNEDCVPANNSVVGAGCNLTSIRPKVLPNATIWSGASVSTFFNDMQKMIDSGNQYGFDKTVDITLDTHMLKNNEWGAVAYLTQSIYGRCSSSTSCSEVGINNNSSYVTGYGVPVGSAVGVENGPYNTTQGMDASTTGNIYGVYDMSGGANEYVMGNYNNKKSSSQFTTLPNAKYYNVYTTESDYTNAGLQHALTETKNWYGDYASFVVSSFSWFYRGGYYNDTTSAGVFNFNNNAGNSIRLYGSRLSVTIN